MTSPPSSPFQPDALEANRRGGLSDAQRRGFGALVRSNRGSALNTAFLLTAGAVVVYFFASPNAPPLPHVLIPALALAIAGFLVVRVISGADALSRDLGAGRVESVEGAIGKRRIAGGRHRSTYFLDVGDRRFTVSPATYAWAPDAGMVRLYFLPASRKIVNFELLADAPVPADVSVKGIADLIGAAFRAPSRRERNEVRASVASLGHAMEAAFTPTAAAPPATRDPRPLAEALLGSWGNGFLTVTFSPDGGVTTRMLNGEQHGRWSVEGGRLRAEIAGQEQAADAWVAGDQLTIALAGEGLTLTRQ